jgi:hypothetical protein
MFFQGKTCIRKYILLDLFHTVSDCTSLQSLYHKFKRRGRLERPRESSAGRPSLGNVFSSLDLNNKCRGMLAELRAAKNRLTVLLRRSVFRDFSILARVRYSSNIYTK